MRTISELEKLEKEARKRADKAWRRIQIAEVIIFGSLIIAIILLYLMANK